MSTTQPVEPSHAERHINRGKALLAGGILVVAGSLGLSLGGELHAPASGAGNPVALDDEVEAEYSYQDMLIEMETELEDIYGEAPPEGTSFLEFIEAHDTLT